MAEDTETTESTTTELSTQVGDFRRVQMIDDGSSWDVDIATSVFYQFIIPTTRPLALQKNIQDGLTSWLASKSEWSDEFVGEAIKFDPLKFKEINQIALNKLLNSTLLELQNNASEYTEATYKVVDEQGNETGQEKQVPFGYNLQNPKGFSISDDKVENEIGESKTYKEWLKVVRDGKVEISALNEEMKSSKGDIKETLKEKVSDMREAVRDAESIIEQMKNFSYNDNVTLREVLQNTKDAQRFYLRLSFDPDDPKVAMALGNLIGEEYVKWNENQDLFEQTFGVDWETYKNQMNELQNKYYKKMGLSSRIVESLKSEEELELDVDEFINTFELKYPITVKEFKEDGESYDAEIDNKEELLEWINNSEMKVIEKTLQPLVNKALSELNAFSKGAGTTITLNEPRPPTEDEAGKRIEFYDKAQRMSKEDISRYVIKDLFNADNIVVPKNVSDKVKANIKIKIKIDKTISLRGFKEMYARMLGAESEEVVGVKKDPMRKTARAKGIIQVNEVKTTKGAQDFLPYFKALAEYKDIRKALTAFLRRKKTTEEAEEGKKKWISEGNYRKLAEYLNHLFELQQLQEETSNFDFDLEPVNLNFWLTPEGDMKGTYNSFIKKIAGYAAGGKGAESYMSNLLTLVNTFKKLDEIKEDYLDKLEEAQDYLDDFQPDSEDFDTLTEEEYEALSPSKKKEYLDALKEIKDKKAEAGSKDKELSEGQQLAQQQRDELDEEENLAQELQNILEGTFDMDFETGETVDTLEDDLDEVDNSELVNYLTEMDGDDLTDIATLLFDFHDDLSDFVRYKNMNINSANFKKMLNSFGKLTKMDTEMSELIKTIESGVFTEEGEQKTEESKAIIENVRTQIENFWDESKTSFQEPKKEDFIRLVNVIDLTDAIADAMEKDLGFNDSRHAIVELDVKQLEVVVDLKGNEIKLKGRLAWTSKGTHYIDYKEKGGYIPKYWAQKQYGELPQTRQGAQVDYAGKEQVVQAKPIDTLRLKYFKEIRTRTQLLVGAIR
jgi:hypothetical protein